MKSNAYPGLAHDSEGGMTHLGRIVKDAWVFSLIPESEDCTDWGLDQMQILADQVAKEWDTYGNLPSRLPAELRERHTRIYTQAIDRAREGGWDPELFDED